MKMEVVATTKPTPAASMPSSLWASASAGPAGGGEFTFTADDLAAADQLVQLSVSGGGGGDEVEDQCCSDRSVNNAAENEEGAAGRGLVDRRVRKRYRLVSELYAATRQVKAAGGGGGSRKRKGRDDGVENRDRAGRRSGGRIEPTTDNMNASACRSFEPT